jgi:hypothetical protein
MASIRTFRQMTQSGTEESVLTFICGNERSLRTTATEVPIK